MDVTDFTSWAFGLKQAGYATNPNYPAQLIKIINNYDLAQYTLIALEQKKKGIDFEITKTPAKASDSSKTLTPVIKTSNTKEVSPAPTKEAIPTPTKETTPAPISLLENTKVTINHTKAIVATKGSSLLAIATQQKISLSKLFEYNELDEMNILDQDRILFIEKKQKFGASESHTTLGTETLYSIAQKEGVLLSSVLALNAPIAKDSILPAGQKIKLRAEAVSKPSTKKSKKSKKGKKK
jgi:LysM repeat protein